jgi:hypothetical protein
VTSGRIAPALDGRLDPSASAGEGSSLETSYRIAGLGVHVRIAGRALAAALLPALVHLRVEDEPHAPDLGVSLWDESVSSGGASWRRPDDGVVPVPLQSSPDGRRFVRSASGGILWLDLDARSLAGSFTSAAAVPPTERAKPLAVMLAPWLRDRGRQILHAAMVVARGAGVLVAGRGGAGKSTVALAAGLAGLGYVGDDLVALEETRRGGFVGHSLYASCFLGRSHLERFPALPSSARGVLDVARDKVVLQLAGALTGGTVRAAPVTILLVPRLTDARACALRPASALDALRALAPSSLLANPGQGQAELDRMERLVRTVPRWWLDLGGEVTDIPALVTRALEQAGR